MIRPDVIFTAYSCADCDPEYEGDEAEFERAYTVLVPEGADLPFEFCPQCGSIGGFTNIGEYTTRSEAARRWAEKQAEKWKDAHG